MVLTLKFFLPELHKLERHIQDKRQSMPVAKFMRIKQCLSLETICSFKIVAFYIINRIFGCWVPFVDFVFKLKCFKPRLILLKAFNTSRFLQKFCFLNFSLGQLILWKDSNNLNTGYMYILDKLENPRTREICQCWSKTRWSQKHFLYETITPEAPPKTQS